MYGFKEAPAVTSRPSSTALLAISSKDRFKDYPAQRIGTEAGLTGPIPYNASPYEFQIIKPESIMNGFFTRLAVTEFSMDWVIPNINQFTDEIIVKGQTGGTGPINSYTINIPQGFFAPSEIAAKLQTAIRLDTGFTGFTMTYGTDNNNPYFLYNTNSASQKVAFQPLPADNTYTANRKQLFDVLGFSVANETLQEAAGGNTTYCNYTDYIDVVCPTLTYNQPLKDTMSQSVARDSLCRVYLNQITGPLNANTLAPGATGFAPTGTRPFQVYHNYTHPKEINWTPNQPVGQLSFTLYDDSGNKLSDAVPSTADGNWSMSLLVSEN